MSEVSHMKVEQDSFQCIDPACPDAATYHDHGPAEIILPSVKRGDAVYTPRWVAKDMVKHFKPSGRILETCKGPGVFMEFLPDAEWCEITEGRDFFEWTDPVDWTVSNPPYSKTRPWFKHSYTIAANLLYLVPLRNIFSGFGFVKEIHDFGGIVEIRLYGTGGSIGFPMGNAVGAFHVQRGYKGATQFSFAVKP
jgi:hypothetical protein